MEVPQGMTYAALGFAVLGTCAILVYAVVRIVLSRMTSQSATSNEFDQRLPVILDTALKPWQEAVTMQKSIIDEERKEKQRAQDEREHITKQLIEYATVTTKQHAQDLASTRDQFTESQRRLYARVEKGEKHHEECALKLAQAEAKISQLEQRQYNTALLTPVAAVAPVAPAAPTPSATTTFSMPSTGFTITPGVPG